jgi:hypothetical protein
LDCGGNRKDEETEKIIAIDYRFEDRNKVGELRGDVGAIRDVLTPSSRKPRSSP